MVLKAVIAGVVEEDEHPIPKKILHIAKRNIKPLTVKSNSWPSRGRTVWN